MRGSAGLVRYGRSTRRSRELITSICEVEFNRGIRDASLKRRGWEGCWRPALEKWEKPCGQCLEHCGAGLPQCWTSPRGKPLRRSSIQAPQAISLGRLPGLAAGGTASSKYNTFSALIHSHDFAVEIFARYAPTFGIKSNHPCVVLLQRVR